MVRQWQEMFFERRYSFTDIKNPDFVAVAKGFFIDGERVKEIEELEKGIDRLLATKKPYLLETMVKREGNVFPMVATGASVSEIRLE